MAERLTDKHTVSVYNNSNSEIYLGGNEEATKYIYKLAQLEDIMEKYHCNDIGELDMKLANFDNFMKGNKFETIEDLQNALNGKFIEVFDEKNKIWQDIVEKLVKTEKDRDTWQKACEFLAYKYAEEYFDGRDIEHCFNADKRDKFVKENINRFYQQAKTEGNDE